MTTQATSGRAGHAWRVGGGAVPLVKSCAVLSHVAVVVAAVAVAVNC
jgi:hypothetical protein